MKSLLKAILRTVLVLFVLINIITAFHACKFTHFYNARDLPQSNIPKTGWGIVKSVCFGMDAYKRPNDAKADSGRQTVYFTCSDSTRIEGWYIPVPGVSKGTCILFHGHGSNKSALVHEAEAFRKMGYHTLLVDFRAHGNSSGNTCTIGYYEGEEVKLAYDFIKTKGEKNLVLWGISMGAAAITRAMYVYPLQPSRLILEMPFATILNAAEGRLKIMHLPPEPLAAMVTFWGGVEHGFWAFNMKPAEYVRKINVPVLLQWGRRDLRVSQQETALIYDHLPGKKQLVVYENSGHESLCKNENEKWLKTIQYFLDN